MMSPVSSSMERQKWLESAVAEFREHFEKNGYTVPTNVRVSIGFPRGSHGGKKAIGQCWSATASKDAHYEIFASPELGHDGNLKSGHGATIGMLQTIGHELVHATVGTECGHKGAFKRCAMAVGFEGPMTSTPAGERMRHAIEAIISKLGEFPAGALNPTERKKQTTRLLKCECEDCGYVARVTRKWVESSGAPICPVDSVFLKCEDA